MRCSVVFVRGADETPVMWEGPERGSKAQRSPAALSLLWTTFLKSLPFLFSKQHFFRLDIYLRFSFKNWAFGWVLSKQPVRKILF